MNVAEYNTEICGFFYILSNSRGLIFDITIIQLVMVFYGFFPDFHINKLAFIFNFQNTEELTFVFTYNYLLNKKDS